MAITGNVGGIAPDVIQRYILNADQYKAEIKDVAKEVRKQKKEEKDLKVVMDAVTKSEKKTTAATNELTRSTKKSSKAFKGQSMIAGAATVALGNLATKGFGMLTHAMKESVKIALDFEDWIGKDTAALEGMRSASAGLVNDLQLMKARTRLLNGDFKLTEKQLEAVTKAAVHFTRVNKTTFAESLQKITDTITSGRSRGLKDLGINIDLLGKASVKTSKAIDLITDRFGGLEVQAANTNERLDQIKNVFTNIVGEIGAAILQSEGFTWAMKTMADTARRVLNRFRQSKTKDRLEEIREQRISKVKALSKLKGRAALTHTGEETSAALKMLSVVVPDLAVYLNLKKVEVTLGKENVKTKREELKSEIAGLDIEKQRLKLLLGHEERKRLVFGPPAPPGAGKKGARRRKKRPPDIVQQIAGKGELDTFGDIFGEEYTGIPGAPEGGYQFDIAAAGLQKYAGASNAAVAADLARADALRQAGDAQKESIDFLTGQGTPALAQFTGGLWAAADAAIQGGDSMGLAVAKMVKATLLGLAQEATIKAVFYGAEALAAAASLNFPAAAKFGAAAAIMGGVAAGAGTAGLLLSAATAQGGSTGRKKSATSKTAGGTAYRPGFGRTVEPQRAIVLNLYINDPENPTQQVITDAMIQKAALPA